MGCRTLVCSEGKELSVDESLVARLKMKPVCEDVWSSNLKLSYNYRF